MKRELTLFAAIALILLVLFPPAIALPAIAALAVYVFGWRAVKVIVATFIFAAGLASVAIAADAAPQTVVIPWGAWLNNALQAATPIIGGGLVWIIHRVGSPIVSTLITDRMIANAVDYALATVSGAVADKTLEVDIANEVMRSAVSWFVVHEPAAAARFGAALGPMIAARLSAVGAAPVEALVVPKT